MKITPMAQGTGVPTDISPLAKSVSPDRMQRAKAIAAGEAPQAQAEPVSSGDAQVDRLRKIKMKTQVSTNRDDGVQEPVQSLEPEVPSTDTSEPAVVDEETKPLSPQFAALAKAKRALQVKESELAKREEALKSQGPANLDEYVSKADLLANPLKIFDTGVTYDQLTEAILANQNGQNIDPAKLRAEIKEDLKKELLGEFSTRDQAAEAQVLADIRREANNLTAQGEQFEAIRAAKAQQQVVDLIHRTFKSTGEVMDVMEAAELVETQLIEESLPFAQLKKVQSRLTPAQEAQAAQIPAASKPGTKVMRTLTNRDNALPTMDRRARAMAAMQGTLKR